MNVGLVKRPLLDIPLKRLKHRPLVITVDALDRYITEVGRPAVSVMERMVEPSSARGAA
jgi:hypothetical protein